MKKVIHKADTRGYADHGWLKTNHTFSFGQYYEPERTNFGVLRVLNDDLVEAGYGFGTHPHENMEIVSVVLEGELAHKDSEGNEEVIRPGEIQVMSAGTGVRHSEYNHSKTEHVSFLQIWIVPDKNGHEPRYAQKAFESADRKNKVQTVISPNKENGGLWLNQKAWFSLADLDGGESVSYSLKQSGNGMYLFLLEGDVEFGGETLSNRDGIGVWEFDSIEIEAKSDTKLLLIEIPMA